MRLIGLIGLIGLLTLCLAEYDAEYDYNGDHIINYLDLADEPNSFLPIAAKWLSIDPAYGGNVPTAGDIAVNAVESEPVTVSLTGTDDIFGGRLRYVITAISSQLIVQATSVGAMPIEPNDLPYTLPAYASSVYVWASETGTYTIKYKAVNLDASGIATVTVSAVGGDDSKLEFNGQGYVTIADSELDGARPDIELGFCCWFRTNNPAGILFKKGNIEFGLQNGRLYGKYGEIAARTLKRFDDGRWYMCGMLITPDYAPYLADPNWNYYSTEREQGSGNYAVEIAVYTSLGDYDYIAVDAFADKALMGFAHTGDIDNEDDIVLGYRYIGSIDRCMMTNTYSLYNSIFEGAWSNNIVWYNIAGRNSTGYGLMGFVGTTPKLEYRYLEDGPVFQSAAEVEADAVSTNGTNVQKKMIRKYEKVRLINVYQ